MQDDDVVSQQILALNNKAMEELNNLLKEMHQLIRMKLDLEKPMIYLKLILSLRWKIRKLIRIGVVSPRETLCV